MPRFYITGNLKKKVKGSIRFKLFLISTLAILTPVLLFGLMAYQFSSDSVESDFIKLNLDNNVKIAHTIDDSYYSLQKQIFSQLILQEDIIYILDSDSELYTDRYFDIISRLDNFFSFQLNSNANLFGISLIDLDGDLKYTMNLDGPNSSLTSVKNEEWFTDTLSLRGETLFHQPHYNDFLFYTRGANKTSIVSISQVIYNPDYGKPIGVILLDQETEQFFGYPSESFLSDNHSFVIFSNKGEPVYSNREITDEFLNGFKTVYKKTDNEAETFKIQIEGQSILFMTSPESKFGFKVISALPVSEMMKRSLFLRNNTFVVTAILLILIIIASIVISRVITLKIETIKSIFGNLGKGDFDMKIPVKGTDEIAEIKILFNKMVLDIQSLIDDKYHANLLRKQAELDSLYSQINPHFLYNTLNSIKMVIDSEENESASSMVLCLSDFLRYTLRKGKTIVSVYEEIEHTKNYMSIQKERYDNRYDIRYEIAPETLYAQLPWLTLQPLLENSMKHGLEHHREEGEIHITTRIMDKELIVYIYDNGIGIPSEKLILINEELSKDSDHMESAHESVGIFNVNSRIKLHFGKDFGLSLSSREGENTVVKIRLPFIEKR